MSSLLRLSNICRIRKTSYPLRTPTRPISSSFSRPTQFPSHLHRTRRPYTDYSDRGESRSKANLNVLYALMGTNIAIFGYGMYTKIAAMQGHQGPFIKFLQNMTLNSEDFRAGRYWTLMTSVFTHLDFGHVFSNMFTVYFLGRFLAYAPQITPGRYAIIALGSGLAGSVGFLVNRAQKMDGSRMRDRTRGLGFSGAVMGISSVAACLRPSARVAIWGIIPMPLWALVTGYALYDGYYLNSNDSTIGHAGHLGGLIFGGAYYLLRLRGMRF